MEFHYSIFGLRVRANRRLPGPVAVAASARVDLRIRMQERPPAWDRLLLASPELWCSSPYHDGQGNPALVARKLAAGRFYRLTYSDGMDFVVDRTGTCVWANWPERFSLEDAADYLLGPVLGFVLRLRGTLTLHASAIALEGGVVAVMGLPGAGKSTTAAAFAQRGYPILADDIVALVRKGRTHWVQPAFPRLNLWPESVEVLFGSKATLPPLAHGWDKCYLDLNQDGYRFQDCQMPLSAIYVLDSRTTDSRVPYLEPLGGHPSLLALVLNTYLRFLMDKPMRAAALGALGEVARRVPLRRVVPHSDPTRLSELCDLILEDHSRLAPAAAITASLPCELV